MRRVGNGGSAIDQELVARLLGQKRERDRLSDLTDLERDVLALMAKGRSNQGIAERLYLAPQSVETHIHRIFSKLGLSHDETGHRRVLAVIAYLNGNTAPSATDARRPNMMFRQENCSTERARSGRLRCGRRERGRRHGRVEHEARVGVLGERE